MIQVTQFDILSHSQHHHGRRPAVEVPEKGEIHSRGKEEGRVDLMKDRQTHHHPSGRGPQISTKHK